jgi:hypothetical protein
VSHLFDVLGTGGDAELPVGVVDVVDPQLLAGAGPDHEGPLHDEAVLGGLEPDRRVVLG